MAGVNSARRGYVPDDARNFSAAGIDTMRKASRHIVFLINEGYDLKQATTFVGNHFLLSERQRLAVMRSLATNEQLKNREKKRRTGSDLSGEDVWIDGFNTIITLEVLLSDSILSGGTAERFNSVYLHGWNNPGPGGAAGNISNNLRNRKRGQNAFRCPDGNEDSLSDDPVG